MFTKKDIGRKLIITNLQGAGHYLETDKEYTIKEVYGHRQVLFEGVNGSWQCTTDEDYFFTNTKKEKLEKGDRIILLRGIQSIKENEKVTIKEFLDDNNEKIVVDGLLPGGWIDSSKVMKIRETKNFRTKSLLEIMYEYGSSLSGAGMDLKLLKLDVFGKPLNEIEDIQEIGKNFAIKSKFYKFLIHENLITDVSEPIINISIVLIGKDEMIKISGGASSSYYQQLEKYLGTNIKNLDPEINLEKILPKMVECFAMGTSFKLKKFILHGSFIKAIPIDKLNKLLVNEKSLDDNVF